MGFRYMQYPTKVKELAVEIITACNDYKARKIDNDELKEVILYYASKYPDKLFNGPDFNPTIKKMIGKQRIELLNNILEGFQNSFLKCL